MQAEIIKSPDYENDDMLIRVSGFSLDNSLLQTILNDPYIKLRHDKFLYKDISHIGYENFKDRPSLRNIENTRRLEGSVYTYAVNKRNGVPYEAAIQQIREMFKYNENTRRAMLRITNSIDEYHQSEIDKNLDVSCLSLIHYLKDQARLVFRSSDIENELFSDLITIYQFFLKPVYDKPINISIYASTSQNFGMLQEFINKVNNL